MNASKGLHDATAPFANIKILIIDDEPANVALLEAMLSESGYKHVKSIMDSRLALETCKTFAPDLILLDLIMPHLDGFAVLEALRSPGSDMFLPVIVLTADVNDESKYRAFRAGATDYLLKPFDQIEVLMRMSLFVERRRIEHDLRQQKEKAETTKDRFLAMASHELRTPLTPVLAWASGTAKEANLSPDIQEGLEMVCRNLELEARMIDDMLDLTSMIRSKLKLRRAAADAHELLRHAIEMARSEIEDRHLKLSLALDAAHHELLVDAPRLQQAFWNVLRNACKFTPDKGNVSVRSYNGASDRISIEISDSGVGIEPSFLKNIFNAFEQADSRREGLGLGLAISKAIIEMHGGTIDVRSEGLGKGATFVIDLPTNRRAHGDATKSCRVVEKTTKPTNRIKQSGLTVESTI
jgi:signal transduction histidine kinase